jgi:hypothetical protein
MKNSFRNLIFVFFLSVVFVFSFTSLQAVNDEFGTIAKRQELDRTIAELRQEIKAKGQTFTVGINPAMQYSIEQLCTFKPELRPIPLDENIAKMAKKPTPTPEPTPGDDSYIAPYTSVKNQGSCGSAWAFSTIGAFESVLLKNGINVDLSEQWLVSCNTDGGGCNGGWFANDYMINPGAVLESCYPYTGTDSSCVPGCPFVYQANGQGSCNTIQDIKDAITAYGSVSCAVYVNSAFLAYDSGVFNGCQNRTCNHTVLLVGWDDSLGAAGAWRMKNSWGTGWGENGLMWIEYGCSNIGYGANYLTY